MKKQLFRVAIVFALAAVDGQAVDLRGLGKLTDISPTLRHVAPHYDGEPKFPAGLTLVDWKQIKAEYERHRHGMFPDGAGGFQSRSHYHGWLVRFDGKGFEVDPDTESWTWGLDLVSWGRKGHEKAASGGATLHVDVNRVEYRRQYITEWFVNGREGLDHGFTIAERPKGSDSEIILQLRQRGELVAELDAGGQGVSYKTGQGEPALQYRKLMVTDARGLRLPARMLTGTGWLQILVNDQRAVYPILIDPIAQQAYLKASNTGPGDYFSGTQLGYAGSAVAISGDTVVVGARGEDSNATGVNGNQSDNSLGDSGAAYVFVRNGTGWSQQAYLKASNPGNNNQFGESVAISGDTIVVGASLESGGATGVNGTSPGYSLTSSGAAYVFVRNGTSWSQQAYLKASNTGADDRFGLSVAISTNTIVVGAHGEQSNATGVNGNQSDNSGGAYGAAYVFIRSGTSWSQQAYLKASNTSSCSWFGWKVAISGDTVLIGTPGEHSSATGVNGPQNNKNALYSGAAYVFQRVSGTWVQQAYLKASNTEADDRFGHSVAISGDTVVVGAVQEDSNATGVNGTQSDNSASSAGAAYVFIRNNSGIWSQQAYLKASNSEAGDRFGESVEISGDTVVVGAPWEDSSATGVNGTQSDNSAPSAGAAYVFVRNGGTWSQQAYLKASNAEKGDSFGATVAISGNTVVVGSPGEASSATGVNGAESDNSSVNSGAAYVFALPPMVTNISPVSGPLVGGQTVTITGQWLTDVTSVSIGGIPATNVAVLNSTALTATTPPGIAGAAVIVVSNQVGSSLDNTTYTYYAVPSVNGISPVSGPLTGGQAVTITGSNFTSDSLVNIGGAAARSTTVVNNTTITAITPAGSSGWASVLVTTTGGTNSPNTLYTYQPAPTVTSISPVSGPLAGGQPVMIKGANFTDATSVTIGGIEATSVSVVDLNTITATTPPGSAGQRSVVVTTPGGSNAANALYTYQTAPTVTGISPVSGPLGGGQLVAITGGSFIGATGVTIGGTAATAVTVVNATTITATVPAGTAGTASVVITTPSGANTANSLYTYQTAPTVSAVSPASGPLGGGQAVTLTGTNFIGATAVTIGGVAATAVTVVSSTTITATTPPGGVGSASFGITTPSGTNAGNTLYTYQPAPSVTSITPVSGPLIGGQAVTITGANFTGATSVTIGGAAATGVSFIDVNTITATTPSGTAGQRSVVVTTPGGVNAANTLYTYQTAPTVTAISPVSGPLGGGQVVTITGTNFTGATGVTIGGATATAVTVVNAATITATVPAGTAGAASVLVTTPSGINAANSLYLYQTAPTVSSVSPASGPLGGGQVVTITGTNFIGTSMVTIGGVAATGVTVVNGTTITANTPAGVVGSASILVTTPSGTNAANTVYTYQAAPTVTSISPVSGPLAGGQTVSISGTNFTGATSVTIGGAAATSFSIVGVNTITATTPAGTAGQRSVIVTTPGGSNSANNLYRYQAAPTVAAISPATGPLGGAQAVTITGANFIGATGVTIGGAAASGVAVVNATTIAATTPAGIAGTASLVITTPSGVNSANSLYTYQSEPTVGAISPISGPLGGGQSITLTGTNFTGASAVTIGGAAATGVTVVNATTITAITPAGVAGSASVRVTTPGGVNASNALYTYQPAPTVTQVSPPSGPLTGGQQVRIMGTSFLGAISVTIGGAAATNVGVVDANTITATTPARSAGTASVLVTTPSGTNGANSLYSYQTSPTVTAISPRTGPLLGGQSVTITGTDFIGTTAVTIGGSAATSVTVLNATTITATTPAGIAGTASVLVTTPSGTNAANTLYLYQDAPSVTGINPAVGPVGGGQSVTIVGTNFTGATALTIGGATPTGITVVNSTNIVATTPAGTAGPASVLVTTPSGTNSANTLYTYQAAPAVTAISPSSGPLAGGQSVTLAGTNFTGATAVTIGGVAAIGVTVVNATTITVTTPSGTSGTASVQVTTPGGTSATNMLYTYQAAPTVTAISPSAGPLVGGQSVTIAGTKFVGATAVTIGGAAATGVTVVNATTITATTPPGAAGTASVLVTTPSGTNAANTLYSFQAAPMVTSISPSTGPLAGGQSVTITGTNFTGATAVTIGGAGATGVTVVNATTITATTPAGTAGSASVLVTTPGGTNAANTLYTYQATTYSFSTTTATAPAAAGSGSVGLTVSPSGASWTASSNSAWLTVTPASGTGSATLNYSYTANPTVASRTGTITVGTQTFTLTQSGVTGSVTLAPNSDTAPAAGAIGKSVTVTANAADFAWTATSNAAWLTITAGASTTGSGTVTYNVAANTSVNSRSGTLTIGGQTFTVTQSGATPTYTLASVAGTAPATSGSGTVGLTVTPSDATWTTTSNAAWLTVTPANGTGSATLIYSYTAATTVASRTGTITVGGQTFTLTQSGLTGGVSLTPTSDTAPAAGATGKTVTVTSNAADFAWTATSNAAWLTITAGASTTGSGTVTYNVAANTSVNSRSGTLTIGGQTFTVTQSGATPTYTLASVAGTAPATSGSGTVGLTVTPSDATWTTTSNAAWLNVTPANSTGSATLTYSYTAAATVASRTGTFTVGGQTFTLTQSGLTGSVTLTPTSDTAAPAGATGKTVTVTANAADFAWTATSNAAWLTITAGASTTGSGSVTYNVAANTSANSRTGTLTIGGQTFTVTQSGVTPTYSFSQSSATVGAGNGSGSVSLTVTPADAIWTASSSAVWLTVSPASGTGSATLIYFYTSNGNVSSRTGTITVGGQTFTVTQNGVSGSVTLNPVSDSVPASGATGKTVSVTTNAPDYYWTASSNAAWLTITAGNSGTGGGVVTYNAAANSSANARTGTLTIGGLTFAVPQSGVAAAYSLSQATASVGSASGSGTVALSVTPGDASWTAASNAGWLTVSPASGTSSAILTYTFSANTTANSRTGTLTVGGQTFTVTQAGGSPSLPIWVTPSTGNTGRQVFSFLARNTSSANNILYAQVLFSKTGVNAANGCYISYDPAGNAFYLLSDDVTTWFGLQGGTANTVGNSQCTISGAASGSSKSGTDLTINVDISFRTGFAGTKTSYLLAGDISGATSAWQQVGTWSDTGDTRAVELISLSPSSGSGGSVTFTSVVKDSDGATTIPFTQFVINAGLNGYNACFIHYDRASNAFFLLKDDASGWFGLLGGTPGQVANGQCVLKGTGSGGTASGDTLMVTYNLQLKSGFTGSRQIYLQAVDNSGVIQSWKQMGAWTVSGATISSVGGTAQLPSGSRSENALAEPGAPVFETPNRYRVIRDGAVYRVGDQEADVSSAGAIRRRKAQSR